MRTTTLLLILLAALALAGLMVWVGPVRVYLTAPDVPAETRQQVEDRYRREGRSPEAAERVARMLEAAQRSNAGDRPNTSCQDAPGSPSGPHSDPVATPGT